MLNSVALKTKKAVALSSFNSLCQSFIIAVFPEPASPVKITDGESICGRQAEHHG